jgi:hypothetical protein
MSVANGLAALLGLGAYLLLLFKTGSQAAVKASAEEAAKAVVRQLTWPGELAREIQKSRGVERQELRFKSYGALWKELRPLAIYDAAVIDKKAVGELSSKLSDWYFSECGGLLLTPQARDFYFALQDLLRATAKCPKDWNAERPEGAKEAADIFQAVLVANQADGAIAVLEYLSHGVPNDWQDQAAGHAKNWQSAINALASAWNKFDSRQRFATLQQVGSILRTSLAYDLESRTR